MARLPAAPGAYGQPPVPPVDASKQAHAVFETGNHVGQRGAPRVVEVVGEPLERNAGRGGAGQLVHLAGHADADGVAEADLVDAKLEQPQADLDDPAGIDATGVRAAEGRRDVAPPPPAELRLPAPAPARTRRASRRRSCRCCAR